MTISLLGIRHHGPGSARAVLAELDRLQPEVLLIEGPPEADDLVRFVADEGMRPPVALLGYAVDEPRRAAFWPFATFSPEWQAIRWALANDVPVRFCDLPVSLQLAAVREERREPEGEAEKVRVDPLSVLAAAAGYDDAERWWEDVVEHRLDEPSVFPAIAEAMTAVRAEAPEPPERRRVVEERREAHMRKVLRATVKDGFDRIAVVCGAWHVPALAELPPAAADARVLKGLPKRKVAMSWVPWTHGRLGWWSGYGAGVAAPGWYHHLFTSAERGGTDILTRWLVDAANVLRADDIPVSSAHVIEGVRLAESLAALRGRPLAGLAEVTDATRAVLCDGSETTLELIQRRLVVGEVLGEVPESAPAVPLADDLRKLQRRLRLRPEPEVRELDLDLRKPIGLERSRLLHRLRLLDVDWGEPAEFSRGRGTFREEWQLAWQPELAVAVVEASLWGTTVESAATARIADLAGRAGSVADLAELIERCLLADVAEALPELMRTLRDRAAADREVTHLMRALPPLVRAHRYGDVRGTDTSALAEAIDGLVVRIRVGLPPATGSLDDAGAADLVQNIADVDAALRLIAHEDAAARDGWLDTLASIAEREGIHGLLAGQLVRMLRDAERLGSQEVARRMGLALTPGTPPAAGAAWIEGFLSDSGLLLCHDDSLLALVDQWVAGIPAGSFSDVLPLLRRTFATFTPPERRLIGERLRHGGQSTAPEPEHEYDHARGSLVIPRVLELLGGAR
jgi:hypothetical protein